MARGAHLSVPTAHIPAPLNENSMLLLYSFTWFVVQVARITECQILGVFISNGK